MKIIGENMIVSRETKEALEINAILDTMSNEDISLARQDMLAYGTSFIRQVDGKAVRVDPNMVICV